ncbi:DUF167 domain-containing protein [Patescibacteria group bacterium]|nr:MAG: DUF167 domain-containing protein [Patescibacteria group bacterium]
MAKIAVRVTPNAKNNQLLGWQGEALRLKIAAPPAEGRANAELVAYLTALLKIPKSSITITGGGYSKTKIVLIEGMELSDVRRRLNTTLL